MDFKASKKNRVAAGVLRAVLAATVAFGPAASTLGVASKAAYASDVDGSTTEQADGNRLVRLGMNKSAVIKLPAEANDVIVGNDAIVDAVLRKKDTIYLFAKAAGQTNIFVFDREGQQILALDLEVAIDSLPLRKFLNRQLPGNKIKIDTIGNNLVLSGQARSADESQIAFALATQFVSDGSDKVKLVNAMTIAGENQVMLKVKVIEVQRKVLKQLGVDLQALVKVGENVINLSSLNPFNINGPLSAGGAAVSDNVGNQRFDSAIRAMEEDGLARTLAEPNLTAVSGQQAEFFSGGEYPFTSCDKDGCGTRFKPYGAVLKFTPVVNTNNLIKIKVETEVSEIGDQSGLNIRRAITQLEASPGSTMMIAGLIREVSRQSIAGTPGLKTLPVLGTLFRSRDFSQEETELVVMVTPYLVKPVLEGELSGPDKNYHPSNDKEAIFIGRLNKRYNASGKRPQGEYTGSVGYIVE